MNPTTRLRRCQRASHLEGSDEGVELGVDLQKVSHDGGISFRTGSGERTGSSDNSRLDASHASSNEFFCGVGLSLGKFVSNSHNRIN